MDNGGKIRSVLLFQYNLPSSYFWKEMNVGVQQHTQPSPKLPRRAEEHNVRHMFNHRPHVGQIYLMQCSADAGKLQWGDIRKPPFWRTAGRCWAWTGLTHIDLFFRRHVP